MEIPAELPLIAGAGAHGIGLLRTEFLFMNRDVPPDEEAHFEVYRQIVESIAGDGVTIRVLDWGGEKDMEALAQTIDFAQGGANPALGLRGIRMLLRRPEILEVQFAAILRVAEIEPLTTVEPRPVHQITLRSREPMRLRLRARRRPSPSSTGIH